MFMSIPNVAPGNLNFVKPSRLLRTSKVSQTCRFTRNIRFYKIRYFLYIHIDPYINPKDLQGSLRIPKKDLYIFVYICIYSQIIKIEYVREHIIT